MIGKSEEKLRPQSIFLRRIIARYVVWIEILGYLIVFALIAALIVASTVKADDDFAVIPGKVTLKVQVVQADKNALVSAIAPGQTHEAETVQPSGRTTRPGAAIVTLEESPGIVARASLRLNLEKQLAFARSQKQSEVAAQIEQMLGQSKTDGAIPSAKRPVEAAFAGQWIPAVQAGEVVTSGAVLGILFSPGESTVAIETKDPSVAQNGGKLKPDQPTTISLTMGKTDLTLLAKVTRGGKKDPAIAITDIRPSEAAKIMDSYRTSPNQGASFATDKIRVLVGWKSWASLVWK